MVGHLYLGVCDIGGVLPDRACIFRSGSFIAPRSLQLCLSQPAQKTFLGCVLLTDFPQCGLECSHPALPDREITQVNQQSDRLVVFVGLPLLDVRLAMFGSSVYTSLDSIWCGSPGLPMLFSCELVSAFTYTAWPAQKPDAHAH